MKELIKYFKTDLFALVNFLVVKGLTMEDIYYGIGIISLIYGLFIKWQQSRNSAKTDK